jgi:hypothetical protein
MSPRTDPAWRSRWRSFPVRSFMEPDRVAVKGRVGFEYRRGAGQMFVAESASGAGQARPRA